MLTYKYLGTRVDQSDSHTREILAGMKIGRSTFVEMKKLFMSRGINMKLRVRMLRCYMFSSMLYEVEAWMENHIDKLQSKCRT